MAQVTLAIGFHFRNILLDRSVVRWRHDQVRPFFCDLSDYAQLTPNSIRKLLL